MVRSDFAKALRALVQDVCHCHLLDVKKSFRQWSDSAPVGRVSPGGALNQFGAMKMGLSLGQHDVLE